MPLDSKTIAKLQDMLQTTSIARAAKSANWGLGLTEADKKGFIEDWAGKAGKSTMRKALDAAAKRPEFAAFAQDKDPSKNPKYKNIEQLISETIRAEHPITGLEEWVDRNFVQRVFAEFKKTLGDSKFADFEKVFKERRITPETPFVKKVMLKALDKEAANSTKEEQLGEEFIAFMKTSADFQDEMETIKKILTAKNQ